MQQQLDIGDLISLAYQKGHAEGILDFLAVQDTKDPEFQEKAAEKCRLRLELMECELAEARMSGYLL